MGHRFYTIDYSVISERLIDTSPLSETSLIIVIPCYAEKNVKNTLDSLTQCLPPGSRVECILLINEGLSSSLDDRNLNKQTMSELKQYMLGVHTDWLDTYCVHVKAIPDHWAGVGIARKLGMDEASRRFKEASTTGKGLIVSLDADCRVSSNYLQSIESAMLRSPDVELFNIFFEHHVDSEDSTIPILLYELHLRYFINLQRWLKLPFAFQTIGSSFAVRANAYQKMGGMSRRKAAEDFYFIHKFTKRDTVKDLTSCTVYPSSRPSTRVPFGTGRAIIEILRNQKHYCTYNPQSFRDLKPFLSSIPLLFEGQWSKVESNLADPLRTYLKNQDFFTIAEKLRQNTTSFDTFLKAFFHWFDAFRLMKYLHYARDKSHPDIPVIQALREVSQELKLNNVEEPLEILKILRNKDRATDYRGLSEVRALFRAN